MAEYKGLTIRIGGDTSSLNAALKTSTKAASSLQAQIRQITRAMRFDPADFGNLNTRVKLTENRMEALYTKLRLVRRGYAELGKEVTTVGGSVQTIKQLADATENVEYAAKAADKRYEDVTESLAAMYREFEKLGTASIKRALNTEGADESVDAIISKFRELGIIVRDTDKDVDRIRLDLSDAGRVADIDSLLADLRTLGALSDRQIASNREMRATFKEALGDKDAYDKAAQYQKMAVDMQRIRSEAEGLTSSMREMNTVSKYANNAWSESNAHIKSMDSALSDCAKQAKAYEAALRNDPSNLSAAVGRLKALNSEYELAQDKVVELSQQVEAYKSRLSGVLAEQRNLPKFIQETADEWQRVHGELAAAKGDANALHQSLQKLEDSQAPTWQIRELKEQVREADAKVDELNADARRMDAAFETAKECAELQKLESELSETSSRAAAVKRQMDLTSLGGRSLLNASTIKSAGMTLYSTLTPAITMLGWRAVTAAQDIDSAYRDMRKTVDGTEQQFETLRDGAIEFSKTHVTSAAQLLEIESIGGELGIATENLQKFAETVSNIEVATNYSTEEAATVLGQLANITHMTADEYEGFSDALVRLGNNGASTETQIGDIATRIGSMSTIVGMAKSDILAWASTLASTGQQSEAAGTAFSKTMSLMETAVASAGGTMDTSFDAINQAVMEGSDRLTIFANMAGMTADEFAEAWSSDSASAFEDLQGQLDAAKDNLQKIADVAHMTSDEFAKAWEEDPTVALKSFIEGLNDIEESGGSADSVLGSIGITASRQKQAIEGLMQTIGLLDDNLKMSADAWAGESDQWGASGDAAREAQKKAEGFSGQLQILSNIANAAMASLAEGATPIISMLTDLAKNALDAFETMDGGAKLALVSLLGIGAAAGPVMTMVSTFITAKQNIMAFRAESNAMSKAMAILKMGFADTGNAATNMKMRLASVGQVAKTIGKSLASGLATAAVVAGVTIAIAAITDYIKKMKESEEAARDAGDVIGDAIGGSMSRQSQSIQNFGREYDEMVSKMAQSNRTIQESANKTYGNTAMIEEYGERVKEALEAYNDDKSARNLANLKTQLELYNDAAGTSVTLSEDASGALTLMRDGAELSADAFDRLTDSMLTAAKAEFFKESYSTKMGDYYDALDKADTATKNLEQAQAEYNEALNRAPAYDGEMEQLSQALARAQTEYDKTTAKVNETKSAMDQYEEGLTLMTEAQLENASSAVKWVAENDALQVALWNNGTSVTDFAHNLEILGVGYDDLNAHGEGIMSLASTWDGSIGSMITKLQDMGIEIDETKVDIDSINNKPITVTANVSQASSALDTISWKLASIKSKTVDVVVNKYEGVRSATGSVAGSPYIPRHAQGYIATGPTLTNNGWVGEAGAEAVLNWATGGAVVPLTNTKYMKPIAGAIASEMGGAGGGSTTVYNINLSDFAINDDAEIRSATRDYLGVLLRKGAMNVG